MESGDSCEGIPPTRGGQDRKESRLHKPLSTSIQEERAKIIYGMLLSTQKYASREDFFRHALSEIPAHAKPSTAQALEGWLNRLDIGVYRKDDRIELVSHATGDKIVSLMQMFSAINNGATRRRKIARCNRSGEPNKEMRRRINVLKTSTNLAQAAAGWGTTTYTVRVTLGHSPLYAQAIVENAELLSSLETRTKDAVYRSLSKLEKSNVIPIRSEVRVKTSDTDLEMIQYVCTEGIPNVLRKFTDRIAELEASADKTLKYEQRIREFNALLDEQKGTIEELQAEVASLKSQPKPAWGTAGIKLPN